MSRYRWFFVIGLVGVLLFTGLGLGVRWYGKSTNSSSSENSPADDSPAPAPKTLTLSTDEREYLWDLEHHGNVLGKHGFRALAEALRKDDAAALTALLSADFS